MTTLIPFNPSPNTSPPFSQQVTLDGNPYTMSVNFNLWGFAADGVNKRPYMTLFQLGNPNPLLCIPMVGSPPDFDINLVAGYFNSSVVYRVETGNIEITP